MCKLLKRYDAEIIATLGALGFIILTGYITEKERQIELRVLCTERPNLAECKTIPKPKEN